MRKWQLLPRHSIWISTYLFLCYFPFVLCTTQFFLIAYFYEASFSNMPLILNETDHMLIWLNAHDIPLKKEIKCTWHTVTGLLCFALVIFIQMLLFIQSSNSEPIEGHSIMRWISIIPGMSNMKTFCDFFLLAVLTITTVVVEDEPWCTDKVAPLWPECCESKPKSSHSLPWIRLHIFDPPQNL